MKYRRKKNSKNYPKSSNRDRSDNSRLSISDSHLLQEYGIEYEHVEVDPEELIEQGYIKLPTETFSRISTIFQYAPGLAANQALRLSSETNTKRMLEGAYKVIVKDGMHLAKSKATEGAFRGALLNNLNNQVSGQAELFKISPIELTRAPQYALGVFSIMSAVTGQFYLSEIHNRLGGLDSRVNDIRSYLANEKKSKLWADEKILNQVFQDIRYIKENESDKQASLMEVKIIKREALGNTKFFNSQIQKVRNNFSIRDKKEIIEKAVRDIGDYLPQYWCAVNLYSKAKFLEILISDLDDARYLESVQSDLLKYRTQYINEYSACKTAIFKLLDEAKALNWTGTIPLALTAAASALIPNSTVAAMVAAVGTVATEINEQVKAKGKEAIENDVKCFLKICSDTGPIDAVRYSIGEYSLVRNSTVELVQTSDNAYIRYRLKEEDSDRYTLLMDLLSVIESDVVSEK